MGEDDPGLLEQRATERADVGDFAGAVVLRERAYAAWRQAGDVRRAARLAAYHLAFDHAALFGNRAVAHGWLERGRHLAQQAGDCAESGWVALADALFTDDPARRERLVAEARRLAARFGDADLHFDALAHWGLALVEDGHVHDGMRRLDEASAAARGGEVGSAVVAGEIYCKLLVACEDTLDVRRAEEWQPVTEHFAGRPAVAWASAICRTHYGGILTAAGRWDEADRELTGSLELYDATYPVLRSAALVRLAELRARQGRLGETRRLLDGQAADDPHALRPWARSAWASAADGPDRAGVASALARALAGNGGRVPDVPLLALLAEMQLGAGEVPEAAATAQALDRVAAGDRVEAWVGYARLTDAAVLAASSPGRPADVRQALESAIAAFSAARLPLEEAGARLRLAELVADHDRDLATAEARTAARTFDRLGAAEWLDRVHALLRRLGGPPRPGPRRPQELTEREAEVLALVAQGLSNPQIADRLFISRRTAAHHVSHVLTKLGLGNRAEAAAWAAAHGRDGIR